MSDTRAETVSELADVFNKTDISGNSKPTGEDSDSTTEERKWVVPKKYDYDTYLNKSNGKASTVDNSRSWAANASRYEWDGEYGDVPPINSDLEETLFRRDFVVRGGENLSQLEVDVHQLSSVHVDPIKEFKDAGLHPVMMDTITRLCEFDSPTPIQAYVIPAVLQGKDVVACAQTGSGKTAAYLIPILSRLIGKAKKLAAPRPNPNTFDPKTDRVCAEPLVLVLAPSRELALQIFDESRKLCYRTMLRPCCVYGGAPSGSQRQDLSKGCDVLVGTPGRLVDFLDQNGVVSLNRLRYTVIDEADELVQDDWQESLGRIMADTGSNDDHSFLMFSATFPRAARELSAEYMANDHVRLHVGRAGSTHRFIQQRIVWTEDHAKRQALVDLLNALPPARTLIFVNSRKMAEMIDDLLYNHKFPSTAMHADRTQHEREDALRLFRAGSTPIMVATGVSARGIDVAYIMHVVNFDLPSAMYGGIEEYVHRIGRTARLGNRGIATSFYNERNEDIAEDLAKILVESGQEVPDFLQDKVPEGPLTFEDQEDGEDGANKTDGGVPVTPGDTGFGQDTAGEWKTGGTDDDGSTGLQAEGSL